MFAQIKTELDKDVELGVIAPVPPNTPVEWCSRMSVLAKRDGAPRRVIDLRKLNAATKRQTHPTESPYLQAMSIPSNTIKSCCDAWNGYHSVPLHPDCRKYTIFLTPWGRYWYLVAPQGQNCAGDGYTLRYHMITSDFPRQKRVVDDACLWDWEMSKHF